MDAMTYGRYTARAAYSKEDGCCVCHLIGIRDIFGFDATTAKQLPSRFRKVVNDYLWAGEPP